MLSRRALIGTAAGGLALTLAGRSMAADLEAPSAKMLEACKTICLCVGRVPTFEVHASEDVDNAVAYIENHRQIIAYNELYFRRLEVGFNSDWPALVTLAHEIGHHLQGHTLDDSRASAAFETEADQFAGFVVSRLGGPREDCEAVFATAPEDATLEKPSRQERLTAFRAGYAQADANDCAEHLLVLTYNHGLGEAGCRRVQSEFVGKHGRWVEHQNGTEFSRFEELFRRDGKIYLFDAGRNIWVRLTPGAEPGNLGYGEWGPIAEGQRSRDIVPTSWSPLDFDRSCSGVAVALVQRVDQSQSPGAELKNPLGLRF